MKRIIILALAIVAISSCKLEDSANQAITTDKLATYARLKFSEKIISPCLELGVNLFTDEYMTSEDSEIYELLTKYKLVDKFHQIDPNSYALDGYGILSTGGKTFEDRCWDLGWEKDGEYWISPDGLRIYISRDKGGVVSEMTVFIDKFEDKFGLLEAKFLVSDGQFSFTNPIFAKEINYIQYAEDFYIPNKIENNGLTYNGSIRMETSKNGKEIDWLTFSAKYQNYFDYKSSRD